MNVNILDSTILWSYNLFHDPNFMKESDIQLFQTELFRIINIRIDFQEMYDNFKDNAHEKICQVKSNKSMQTFNIQNQMWKKKFRKNKSINDISK